MNFIEAYERCTENTEAPVNFDAWTMLSTAAALLGRKCFYHMGHFYICPNLYVFLVGPPGLKKTTTIGLSQEILEEVGNIPKAPDSCSKESLIDAFIDAGVEYNIKGLDKIIMTSQLNCMASEFATFIGGSHVSHNIIAFLTEMWDRFSKFRESSRKHGVKEFTLPYFNMLACCTKDWLSSNFNSGMIGGGFSRRCCFCYETERKLLAPWGAEVDPEAKRVLFREAERIFNIQGQFKCTQAAYDWFDRDGLYKELTQIEEGDSAKMQYYKSSKGTLFIKICMILSGRLVLLPGFLHCGVQGGFDPRFPYYGGSKRTHGLESNLG